MKCPTFESGESVYLIAKWQLVSECVVHMKYNASEKMEIWVRCASE
jgi:hypothetical protein